MSLRCPCGTRIDTPGQTRCWRHRYRVHVDPVTPDTARGMLRAYLASAEGKR